MMRVCFTDRFLACWALDLVQRNHDPMKPTGLNHLDFVPGAGPDVQRTEPG
jgi:hypothetical protein